jgi:hypothetical protein
MARKKFKKLLLRLPRFAAPLLQRCIRVFQRRRLLHRIAKAAKAAGTNWRGIQWIKPASHLKATSDFLREVYRRHMARNYRNSLTAARRFMFQEKLQASELFLGKKQSYPTS